MRLLFTFLAFLTMCLPLFAHAEEAETKPYQLPAYDEQLPALKDVFAEDFKVGAAVNTFQLREGSPFYQTVVKHYNVLVTENEMKPQYVNPSKGTFSFDAPDRFVAFGESIGASMRGHTLVWHNQVPQWWFQGENGGTATSEELLSRMETYISTVMGRYKGRIHTWDVVNEAISDSKGLRDSKWVQIIGDLDGDGNSYDFMEHAFRFAREADPDAQLIINDYSLESDARKLNDFYTAVKTMLEKGVPIDGAGIQAHVQMGYPSIATFEQAIERLASLKEYNPNFTVQITELDVSIFAYSDQSKTKEMTPELQKQFANYYADLFDMFRRQAAKGNLDMVVMWGVYDGSSWLDGFPVSGRTNAPLLFDRSFMTKPAFWGLVDRTLITEAVAALEQ